MLLLLSGLQVCRACCLHLGATQLRPLHSLLCTGGRSSLPKTCGAGECLRLHVATLQSSTVQHNCVAPLLQADLHSLRTAQLTHPWAPVPPAACRRVEGPHAVSASNLFKYSQPCQGENGMHPAVRLQMTCPAACWYCIPCLHSTSNQQSAVLASALLAGLWWPATCLTYTVIIQPASVSRMSPVRPSLGKQA